MLIFTDAHAGLDEAEGAMMGDPEAVDARKLIR